MAKGVVRPPPKAKKKTKNGFWPFGGGRTTPKDLGVDSGVDGHPIFGQGGAWSHPRFLSPPFFFFFLIFSFFFFLFFFFYKKNNDKMAKTTSF
jgi:hypothetical protein